MDVDIPVCEIDANCPGWRDWFFQLERPYGQCPDCGHDRAEHRAEMFFG